MQLMISGVHLEVGEAFQRHIEDEIEALYSKHNIDPIEVNVQVVKENLYQHRSVISSHNSRGVIMRGEGWGPDPYTAFNNAIHTLTGRLRRHKKRLETYHKHQGERLNPVAPYYVLGVEEPTPEIAVGKENLAPPIIAELEAEVPTITVGEAVMRLDLSEQPAMLFYNESHGRLNMVYLRKDGNIGWVDPAEKS